MEGLPSSFPLIVIAGVAVLISLRFLARPFRRFRRRVESRTIRVVGVGGGGGNAVDAMIRARTRDVDFVACNTDAQALRRSMAPRRIRIGQALTGGLGTGGDPEIGRRAAEEDSHRLEETIAGSDMVFITAGLGGGTGSGAAPVVAGVARDHGALTLAVVTKPFAFEGARRRVVADAAADELRERVDALIVIPNDRVRDVVADGTSILDAFQVVDDVLRESVQGILDVITLPGLVNLDFADVRAILKDGGETVMGVGHASGDTRALEAARQAMAGPLLEGSIEGARSILFNVTGSSGLSLAEVSQAAEEIRSAADPAASVIFGASFDEAMGDEVRVTVVATGFNGKSARNGHEAMSALPLAPPIVTPRWRRCRRSRPRRRRQASPTGAARGERSDACRPLRSASRSRGSRRACHQPCQRRRRRRRPRRRPRPCRVRAPGTGSRQRLRAPRSIPRASPATWTSRSRASCAGNGRSEPPLKRPRRGPPATPDAPPCHIPVTRLR